MEDQGVKNPKEQFDELYEELEEFLKRLSKLHDKWKKQNAKK